MNETIRSRKKYRNNIASIVNSNLNNHKYENSAKLIEQFLNKIDNEEFTYRELRTQISKLKKNNTNKKILLELLTKKQEVNQSIEETKNIIKKTIDKIILSIKKEILLEIKNKSLTDLRNSYIYSSNKIKKVAINWKQKENSELECLIITLDSIILNSNELTDIIKEKKIEDIRINAELLSPDEIMKANLNNIQISNKIIEIKRLFLTLKINEISNSYKNNYIEKINIGEEFDKYLNLSLIGGIKIDIGANRQLIKCRKTINQLLSYCNSLKISCIKKLNKNNTEKIKLETESKEEKKIIEDIIKALLVRKFKVILVAETKIKTT